MTEIVEITIDSTSNIKLLPLLKFEVSTAETMQTFNLVATLKFTKSTVLED